VESSLELDLRVWRTQFVICLESWDTQRNNQHRRKERETGRREFPRSVTHDAKNHHAPRARRTCAASKDDSGSIACSCNPSARNTFHLSARCTRSTRAPVLCACARTAAPHTRLKRRGQCCVQVVQCVRSRFCLGEACPQRTGSLGCRDRRSLGAIGGLAHTKHTCHNARLAQ